MKHSKGVTDNAIIYSNAKQVNIARNSLVFYCVEEQKNLKILRYKIQSAGY